MTLACGGLGIAVLVAVAVTWEVFGVHLGAAAPWNVPWLALAWSAPALLAILGGGAVLGRVSRPRLAREVDRRLGLEDRVATALAVGRGRARGRLGGFVLADAVARLEAALPRLPTAYPTLPPRSLAIVLRGGALALLLWLALVVASRWLPAVGSGPALPGVRGEREVPRETGEAGGGQAGPDARDAADPHDEPTREPRAGDPEGTPEPPPQRPPEPEGSPAAVEVVLSGEVFAPGESILALVRARPGAGAQGEGDFSVAVRLDGRPFATGESVRLEAALTEGEHRVVRVRDLPGVRPHLQPGEHRLAAVLVPPGADLADEASEAPAHAASAEVTFRVRGDDDGGGGTPPPPPPQAGPEPEPREPPGGAGDESPSGGAEPPPLTPPEPAGSERKVVVPLLRDGERVRKEGPVLVLDSGGGDRRPPVPRPLGEVLPDARRRAEDAVDRAGVRARDRDLVRRYFERLRALAEETR